MREQLTKTGQLLGTPSYMAPEQWSDVRSTDFRADLYAMGCTIHYLLIGTPPFPESRFPTWIEQMKAHNMEPVPSLSEQRNDLPLELENLFRTLLSKTLPDRPASALDVSKQLVAIGRSCGSGSSSPSPGPVGRNLMDEGLIETNAQAQDETIAVEAPHVISVLGALLSAFGVLYTLKTPYGELVIELSDPAADVQLRVDGNEVKVAGLNSPLTLTAGEHGLTVVGADFETVTRKFVVKKSEQTKLVVQLIPTSGASEEVSSVASNKSIDDAIPKPLAMKERC